MAKTKALISFAVTAKLICVFVFAYAKSRFSHDPAHLKSILVLFQSRFYIFFHILYHLMIVEPDKIANYEPSDLNLQCLQIQVL